MMPRRLVLIGLAGLCLVAVTTWAGSETSPEEASGGVAYLDKSGDEELAYLLVKLEKKTREVIATHYGRAQVGGSEATATYRGYLIENRILPAAVADPIFAGVVPGATGGRAWVKMVVPEPRNPNNIGDATALEMLSDLQEGRPFAERTTEDACYYAEPIRAKAACLPCHGEPAGEPDPYFPEYVKNGWKVGEVVGGVIARVEPES